MKQIQTKCFLIDTIQIAQTTHRHLTQKGFTKMNLQLISYPSLAKNIAEAHIEQRIQVPHVPLKFNTNEQDTQKVAIIEDPKSAISKAQDKPELQLFVSLYDATVKEALESTYIYKAEDVVNKTENFIIDLFDRLNLDELNYKTKTGRESLRDDVINKKDVFVHKFVSEGNSEEQLVNLDNYNLEESWNLYNQAMAKAIII